MAQSSLAQTPASGSSALEREADHIDNLMSGDQGRETSKEAAESKSGLNNSTQVEQDNRVAKAKADAQAAGGGPDKPEGGLNQDG